MRCVQKNSRHVRSVSIALLWAADPRVPTIPPASLNLANRSRRRTRQGTRRLEIFSQEGQKVRRASKDLGFALPPAARYGAGQLCAARDFTGGWEDGRYARPRFSLVRAAAGGC